MRQGSWLRGSLVSVFAGLLVAGSASEACVGTEDGSPRANTSDTDASTSDPTGDSGSTTPAADSGSTPTGDAGTVCAASLADCNDDGVCETSTATDPNHCGACGHSCGGGACDKGACKPVALLNSLGGAVDVAVNATAVVVLAEDGPRVCPKTGCVAAGVSPTQLETGDTVASSPHALHVNATDVFWLGNQLGKANSHELKKCAVAGCGLSPIVLDEEQIGGELAIEGNAALRYDPTGLVTRIPLDGVGAKAYYNQLTVGPAGRFALANGKVAFSNLDGATGGNRGIWVGNFANELPTRVMNEGLHVAILGDVVYASRKADATYDAIFGCSFAGCGGVGTNLGNTGPASATGRIADMTSDAEGLYWVEAVGVVGRVMHCPLPGCPGGPKTLAASQDNPVAVTTDESFVYWVNAGTAGSANGTVFRVAK